MGCPGLSMEAALDPFPPSDWGGLWGKLQAQPRPGSDYAQGVCLLFHALSSAQLTGAPGVVH